MRQERDGERERYMEGRGRRERYLLLMRLCSHMLAPPHCLQALLMRLCSHMLIPPLSLHSLLMRLCSHVRPVVLAHIGLHMSLFTFAYRESA